MDRLSARGPATQGATDKASVLFLERGTPGLPRSPHPGRGLSIWASPQHPLRRPPLSSEPAPRHLPRLHSNTPPFLPRSPGAPSSHGTLSLCCVCVEDKDGRTEGTTRPQATDVPGRPPRHRTRLSDRRPKAAPAARGTAGSGSVSNSVPVTEDVTGDVTEDVTGPCLWAGAAAPCLAVVLSRCLCGVCPSRDELPRQPHGADCPFLSPQLCGSPPISDRAQHPPAPARAGF